MITKFVETIPARKGAPGAWSLEADQLRQRPGEWGMLQPRAAHRMLSTWVKKGQLAAFCPTGDFTARSVSNRDGTYQIWGKYIGEPLRVAE